MNVKRILKKLLIPMLVFSLFSPIVFTSMAMQRGGVEELKERIDITNKKRVTPKEIKRFEESLQSYFFEIVELDVIERVMKAVDLKEITPGDALIVIVLVKLSKKPEQEIIKMKKEGKNWTEIVNAVGVKLKDVVKEVKEFQKMSGCA
ncbi:MAG: hypothetical protein Q8N09_06845 [Thermodesulfovibrionia bacterium]|nr:hypothetical protein [Thermodesulfovibrionia bacterium]